MSDSPNLLTSTIAVANAETLPVDRDRNFFMVVNNDTDDLTVKIGRTDGDGIPVIAGGGHLALPNGTIGPIYLTSAAPIDVTVLSALDEAALIA